MAQEKLPGWYQILNKRHPKFILALEELGKAIRQAGPLDEKTAHLIQLAAAAAIRSEGAVHSHVRRATEIGVKPEEIHHAIVLLTSTIGYPNVAAALRWAEDITAAGAPES